jgi:hypothetical protein
MPVLKNRLIIYTLLLVVVFLAGYVPQYLSVRRLNQQVEALSWQTQLDQAGNTIALAFLEVSNNNFGVASQHTSDFFRQINALADKAPQPAQRDPLKQFLAARDELTAQLAKADPASKAQIQNLFVQMQEQIRASQKLSLSAN